VNNRLSQLLGIDIPIVLAPFGGLSSVELTATVSRLGGLGSYGLYGYVPERIAQIAAAIRERTGRPFALNLWLPTGDEVRPDDGIDEAAIAAVRPLFDELGIDVPPRPARFLPDPREQLDAAIAARPAAISVVYGVPEPWLVDRARAAGIRLIGTATTVEDSSGR